MSADDKSIITCDLEGRLETFSDGAERMFGYRRDEVVNMKRVSLFSPGLVVLQNVPSWLSTAVKDGEYTTRTVFLRKDGTPFSAEIRITPTMKKGVHIGYCGVTVALPDVPVEQAYPPIALATRIFRWLVVTRAPFLTATVIPVLIGAAAASRVIEGGFPWLAFVLAMFGALALQVAANTFNDYYDWTSGTDQANTDYFLPFSGGSRSIELGLITPKGLFRLGVGAVVFAALCGALLLERTGPVILVYGVFGALVAFFYTAPPLRLSARKGMGELFVGLCFGPLLTAGTWTALTGRVDLAPFLIGVPAGLLTAAILWINEFPDAPSDAKTGKNHLVVVLGKRAARWGYAALWAAALAVVVALVALTLVPALVLVALLALPLALKATRVLFAHYDDRELVHANQATIQLHLATGLLMAVGIALGDVVTRLLA